MLKKTILSAGLIAAAGMLGAGAVHASVQTFSGSNPPSSGSYASTIQFTFDTTNNDITINIQNTTSPVGGISQAISGITFSLTGFSGSLAIDESALVGYEGTSVASSTELSNSSLHDPWALGSQSQSQSQSYTLGNPKIMGNLSVASAPSAGSGYPKGAPTDLIIDSLTGTSGISPHSPSLFGTGTNGSDGVTFTLDASPISPVTSETEVTGNVTVYFGTGPDAFTYDYLPSNPVPVPAVGELPVPATLPLVGGGIGGLALLALRKRRQLR